MSVKMSKKAKSDPTEITASGLADYLGCPHSGEGGVKLTGFAGLETAGPGDLVCLVNLRLAEKLDKTGASAAVVPADFSLKPEGLTLIYSDNPHLSFIKAVSLFFAPLRPPVGVHPTSVISPTAKIAPNASVGAFCCIGDEAEISEGAVLFPLVSVYPLAKIGAQTVLHSHVSIREGVEIGRRVTIHNGAVIGADGFGYIQDSEGRHIKIPQAGGVIIEDDVEIGANTTIDRAALERTVIRQGTKIDNLVMIAHNVSIGRHVILAAQSGVAGSTRLGDRVFLGGQVGIVDHADIGDGAMINAKSGVTKSLPPGAMVSGNPHLEIHTWRKAHRSLPKLYDLLKEFNRLKKRVEELEAKASKD
jgi:UDP-3-O-[3-hydroxymyristoyl] glucosamine N-acyltransferase